jgi:hypothetical protein
VSKDESDPLRGRDGGERRKRAVVNVVGPGSVHRRGLADGDAGASLLTAVVIEQLVTRDAVDPRQRRVDAPASSQFADRGEKRLLRQILSDRSEAATAVEQIAVHPGQGRVVEAPEAVGLQAECLGLPHSRLHVGDCEH